MNNVNKYLLAAGMSQLVTISAFAAVPNTFTSGTPALASEVNENFTDLDSRLAAIEEVYATVDLDCGTDADALVDALDSDRNATVRTTYNVTGNCNGTYITRSDVVIDGDGSATILGNYNEYGESLYIEKQSNVRLRDINLQGTLTVTSNSTARLEGVTFATPVIESNDDGGVDYLPNLDIRSAYLRIQSGSLDNVSLHANKNSAVEIRSDVTGNAFQVVADGNSTIVTKSNAGVGLVEAIGTSSIFAAALNATEVIAEGGSYIEVDSINASGRGEAYGNSRIAVWGNASFAEEFYLNGNSSLEVDGDFSSDTLECQFNSTMKIQGDTSIAGTFDWVSNGEVFGVSIQKGCHAQFEGTTPADNKVNIDNYSSAINGSWTELYQ
ncbi:hypothetical protein BIY21_02065 [Vibrio ponticus]|uniref:Uncharacterized protein n=1 Tax=Vibrio ponticus TaxID=265668 RepID=A0ABX3FDX2_9VIBR|nr:hypothetical protein [Vibrio ponticus]OLQ90820.1 hypothetical protein BIY21_02065 [Vibrio ponticus]